MSPAALPPSPSHPPPYHPTHPPRRPTTLPIRLTRQPGPAPTLHPCPRRRAKWLIEIRKQNRTEYAKKLLVIAKQLGWIVRDGGEEAIDGITHSEIAFAYDAEVAAEHIAALRENGPSEAGAAAPLKELTAGVDEAEDGGEAASGTDGGAAQPKAADIACLQISDDAVPAEPPQQTKAAPPPLEKVSVAAGSVAQMDASSGKVCAITGEPAKYRDPISGLPYANLAAFKELRKRYPDPKAEEKAKAEEEAKAAAEAAKLAKEARAGGGEAAEAREGEGEEGDGAAEGARLPPSERPIVLGSGFTRRVNKVA